MRDREWKPIIQFITFAMAVLWLLLGGRADNAPPTSAPQPIIALAPTPVPAPTVSPTPTSEESDPTSTLPPQWRLADEWFDDCFTEKMTLQGREVLAVSLLWRGTGYYVEDFRLFDVESGKQLYVPSIDEVHELYDEIIYDEATHTLDMSYFDSSLLDPEFDYKPVDAEYNEVYQAFTDEVFTYHVVGEKLLVECYLGSRLIVGDAYFLYEFIDEQFTLTKVIVDNTEKNAHMAIHRAEVLREQHLS